MLPTYTSPARQRRRPGAALINLGAVKRRIGENPKIVRLGLPVVALFVMMMAGTTFFKEVERLPQTENRGLDQAGSPGARPNAERVPYVSHQSQEQEDWAVEPPLSDEPLPPPPDVAPPTYIKVAAAATAVVASTAPAATEATAVDAAAAATAESVVDTSTLLDDHPWLVGSGEKVAEELNADAQALAKAEQALVGKPLDGEAKVLATEEQHLVTTTEAAFAAEEKAVTAEEHLVEAEVEAEIAKVESIVAKDLEPLEQEVSTVVKEVEIEARVVEAEVSGAVKGGAAEMEVVETAAEEEVIIVVGTMEEMLFSWTFFGVFLFSLYRVSRKERKWWRDAWTDGHGDAQGSGSSPYRGRGKGYDTDDAESGPLARRFPREKLLTPRDRDDRRGGVGGVVFDGDDGDAADDLNEEDRAALELGRLMLQEREAANRMREAAEQAKVARRAFDETW